MNIIDELQFGRSNRVTRVRFISLVAASLITGTIGATGTFAKEAAPRVTAAEDRAPARVAQTSPAGQLPGGATSLRETHGDWIVVCSTISQQTKICGVSQQQADTRSGQRVVAVEVAVPAGDTTKVTLALPFGVLLEKGVVVQVDDGQASSPFAFKTCLPVGCIVEIALNKQSLEAWRKGTSLKFKTVAADGGNEVPFTLSLKGFASAVDRAAALAK
ncbi:invasion associated locus B family protein [Vineibacter terrae]|uniref:invasion associated locus B family protein n=1 Tax=Vineibacter terrae TaxID=2586908 RepID=UPI002E33B837|nr:invasion associated locus B family protein [Vineibacter terrae]HEX2885305.1 invasion associated locus B family protein [Vineibacter terrae]